MNDQDQRWPGWTVVLRRRPARIVEGRPEGGYTEEWEIICCDCGDDPGLDYREVIPALQRIRGPYPIAVGITARRTRPAAPHAAGNSGRRPVCRRAGRSPAAGSPGTGFGRQASRGSMSSRIRHAEAICRGLTLVERR